MDELLDIFRNLGQDDYKLILFASIIVVFLFLINWFRNYVWNQRRIRRQQYYRNVYLKSDDWRRKRYVVLKRDNWKCVHCGNRATQVHHTRYAKYNIGKEPIKWLESVCKSCHDSFH
jgi:5-methylcytosine-specific restriction endonuclease McrA